jgi:small ubiquitin-related modifier
MQLSNTLFSRYHTNTSSSNNDNVTIRVKDKTSGDGIMFTIKKITKMKKVFKVYAQVKGIEESSLCFMLDGERVGDDDTPELLELEDDDQIDCFW